MRNAILTCALGAMLGLAGTSIAQTETDTSGTNPALLSRSLQFSNEYRWLPDNAYYNAFLMRYTQPFADGRAAVRLTLPFDKSDVTGENVDFVGDFAMKFTWVARSSAGGALILSAEVFAPTAAENSLGTGRWVVAPGITSVFYVSPEVIVAPAYVQNFSVAGDEERPDVNRGDLDLYLVYRPQGRRWWVTTDFTASYDFKSEKAPMSLEMAFGRNLAILPHGGAVNGYIRPGVGIGNNRPYDFNIEIGISILNF